MVVMFRARSVHLNWWFAHTQPHWEVHWRRSMPVQQCALLHALPLLLAAAAAAPELARSDCSLHTVDLQVADPEDACQPFKFRYDSEPWVALISRSQHLHPTNCTFDVKVCVGTKPSTSGHSISSFDGTAALHAQCSSSMQSHAPKSWTLLNFSGISKLFPISSPCMCSSCGSGMTLGSPTCRPSLAAARQYTTAVCLLLGVL